MRARFAPGFHSSEPLSSPSQPRNFSVALMWCRAADHMKGAVSAGELGTASGQLVRHGSCQHLLLVGSSSWALGKAAWRLHPALSRALPRSPEDPLPYVWSCFARLGGGDREEGEAESAGLLPECPYGQAQGAGEHPRLGTILQHGERWSQKPQSHSGVRRQH